MYEGWSMCTGGSEIPEDGWPASGTGNAVTWAGGCYDVTENDDGVTKIGFFVIFPDSRGAMWIVEDPRVGYALASDCWPNSYLICRELMGSSVMDPVDAPCDEYFADNGIGYPESPCNPCGDTCPQGTPINSTTWGGIKSHYR